MILMIHLLSGFQAKVTREPTDVKIKFPVPTTEAPQTLVKAGPVVQYASALQPQYATAALPKKYPHRLVLPQYAQ